MTDLDDKVKQDLHLRIEWAERRRIGFGLPNFVFQLSRMYQELRKLKKPFARLNSGQHSEIDGRGKRIRTSDPLVPSRD
jgi:hypothetical protein